MNSQGNVTYSSGADEALIHCKYYDLLAADTYLTNIEMSENVVLQIV